MDMDQVRKIIENFKLEYCKLYTPLHPGGQTSGGIYAIGLNGNSLIIYTINASIHEKIPDSYMGMDIKLNATGKIKPA